MKWRIWDEIKYRIEMTGLLLAGIGVVIGTILLFAPFVLAFIIATIGGWKLLMYILSI